MSLVDVFAPLPNWLPGSGRAILYYDPQGKLLETIHPLRHIIGIPRLEEQISVPVHPCKH